MHSVDFIPVVIIHNNGKFNFQLARYNMVKHYYKSEDNSFGIFAKFTLLDRQNFLTKVSLI